MDNKEFEASQIIADDVWRHINKVRQLVVSYNDKLNNALSDGDTVEATICSDRINKAILDMENLFTKLQTMAEYGTDKLIVVKDTVMLDANKTVPT